MMSKWAVIPVLALAVSGCVTTLDAVGDSETEAPVGLPYQLPRTLVTATTVWTLSACPSLKVVIDAKGNAISIKNENGAEARKLAGGLITFTTGAGSLPTIEEAYAAMGKADFKAAPAFTQETVGGEFYSIDYEALTTGTKTGSLKVEYHEGTLLLKAINAKVDGKEAEALKSAFSLAANVARVGLGIPSTGTKALWSAAPIKGRTETISACNQTTLDALAEKKTLIEAIKDIEAEAAALTAKAAILSSQRLGGTPNAPKTIADLQRQAFDVQDRLDAAKAALAKLNQFLSVEGKVKLPERTGGAYVYQLPLSPKDVDILALRKRIVSEECNSRSDCLSVADMKNTFSLTANLVGRDGTRGCEGRADGKCGEAMESVTETRSGAKGGGSQSTRLQRRTGLVIRQPVEALLTLQQNDDGKVILEKPLMVSQFGTRRTLPLKNRTAESNTLSATFDKNGMPTMIEYTKPRSGAVEVLGALDEGVQTILALQADRRAADKAEADADIARAKNELEALQRQRDMIKVQSEIETMQRVTPTEIEALRAEIATLELLKQIAELKKAIGPAPPP